MSSESSLHIIDLKEGLSPHDWAVPVLKDPPARARDVGSIPGWGRSPGGGHGNPLQDSCLENPMDRGAWWPVVHRGAKESEITEATWHAHRR